MNEHVVSGSRGKIHRALGSRGLRRMLGRGSHHLGSGPSSISSFVCSPQETQEIQGAGEVRITGFLKAKIIFTPLLGNAMGL